MANNSNPTPNNMTYRQMIDTFSTIATNHYQIQSFNSGSLNDVDLEKLDVTNFPLLYVTPNPAVVDAQTLTYSFDVIVATIIQEDFADLDDAYTEMLLILKDVIAEYRQAQETGSYVDQRTDLVLPITCEPFTARFNNLLTGWSATINVDVNNKNNLCIAPIEANT